MRRLVVEISQDEISKFSPSAELLEKIESLEIIYHLRFDKDGFAGICRIKVKDSNLDLRRLVGVGGLVRLVLLSDEKDEHIVYMETRTRNMAWFRGPDSPEVYLCPPIEFKDRKLKLTFVGNLNEIKKLLARAEKVGQKFKIISMTDARFSPDSILHVLTENQRKIIFLAMSRYVNSLSPVGFPERIIFHLCRHLHNTSHYGRQNLLALRSFRSAWRSLIQSERSAPVL